jgi:hypothetical protein
MAGFFVRGRMASMNGYRWQLLSHSIQVGIDWPIIGLSVLIVIGGFLAYHKSMGRSFAFSVGQLMLFVASAALLLGIFVYARYWVSH